MQKSVMRWSGRWALAVAIVATIALGATAAVAFQDSAPTEITVSFGDSSIELSEATTATAFCEPEGSNQNVTWTSSDPDIASVDRTTGAITPHALGQVVIHATSVAMGEGGAIAAGHATLQVVPTKVSSIAVNWASDGTTSTRSMETGTQSQAQVVAVLPSNATTRTVTWSTSDSEVATVAADGTVSAISSGVATITASADDGSEVEGTLTVKVWKRVYADSIAVSAADTSINIGYETTVTASISPDNTTNTNVSWESSDTAIATVDENGNVRGISEGTVRITATAVDGAAGEDAIKGYVDITVSRVLSSGLSITLGQDVISVGRETTAVASVLPAETTDKSVTWSSSNPKVATIDPATGVIQGVSAGLVRIHASSNDGGMTVAFAYLDVTALSLPESVDVVLEPDVVRVGQSSKASATVLPLDAFDRTVTWSSSNELIASVDKDGNITTYASGECTITATTANMLPTGGGISPLGRPAEISASAVLTVRPALVTRITVSVDSNVYTAGTTGQASALVLPEAASPNVTWSTSDASIASVDASGVITALKAGVVTVIATAADGSGVTDAEQITVNAAPVAPVTVKDKLTAPILSTVKVKPGKKFYIKSTITPAYGLKTAPAVAVIQKKGSNGKYRTVLTVKLYVTAKSSAASTMGRYALIKTKGTYRVRVENTAAQHVVTSWKVFSVK